MVFDVDWRKKISPKVCAYENGFDFYDRIARKFMDLASYNLGSKRYFYVILGGGKTPRELNVRIVDLSEDHNIDWSRVILFFSDERCVPPDHTESNYKMISETLIRPLAIPENNVYRIQGELGPDEAAKKCQQQLVNLFGYEKTPVFDLALLGLGSDGHTASLFPNNESLTEKSLWVVPAGKGPEGWERVTLTYPIINSSKNIWFIANGSKKGFVVNRILNCPYNPVNCPAQGVYPMNDEIVYLLDADAASELKNFI